MRTKVVLGLVLILALALPGVASADTYDECTGDEVTGVVVAVDETTGEITLYQEDGTFCTVVKRVGDYDHPVINIIGQFFENVSLEDLAANLEDLQAWVVCDDAEPPNCDFGAEGDEGAVSSTVVGVEYNEGDGNYTITILVDGVLQTFTTDDPGSYPDYLENNTVDFDLVIDKDGNTFIGDGADLIGAYHDEGMGLGVLVKLFIMADTAGVPVDELIARFNDGEGIGQLFKDLGKPDILGVGHVFQELGKNPGHPDGKDKPDKSNKSNNGKGHKDK